MNGVDEDKKRIKIYLNNNTRLILKTLQNLTQFYAGCHPLTYYPNVIHYLVYRGISIECNV